MSDQSVFGKYRLIAELGSGGMAKVFLAVVEGVAGFAKLQVVKRLREDLACDQEFVAMLVDEARIAARLNHPNVVQTNEVGEVNGLYFIAMEYLDGQPFHRVIHRANKLGGVPADVACVIMADALRGLHHAHELADYDGTPLNIVHRDMTPHNVFVTYEGVTKVVDFGIAKAAGRMQETQHGVIKGKLRYMAPEQVASTEFDRRVDLFSVGVMLFELITQTRFWPNKDDQTILKDLVAGKYQSSPAAVKPGIDPELDAICRRALAYAPNDRFATAADFAAAIDGYLGNQAEAVRRKVGPLVADLFADKRAEIKSIVEAQMAGLQSRALPFKPVVIEPTSSASVSVQLERSASTVDVPPADPTTISARRSSLMRWAPAGAAAAAALVLGVLALRGGGTNANASIQPTPPGPSAANGATAPESPAKEDLVTITLRASPANAKLFVDDGKPLDNPQVLRLPKDSKVHSVRAEATGYLARTDTLTLTRDAVVDLALEKDAAKGLAPRYFPPAAKKPDPKKPEPRVTTPAAATPPPPTVAADTKPADGKRKRPEEIDKGDPWSQ